MANTRSRNAEAHIVADVNKLAYPMHTNNPQIELNANARKSKYEYYRSSPQFMNASRGRPDHLSPLRAFASDAPSQRSTTDARKILSSQLDKSLPDSPVRMTTSLVYKNEKQRSITRYERPLDEPSCKGAERKMKHTEEEEARAAHIQLRDDRRADAMAIVEVRFLLNILTVQDFDFITDLIIIWTNSSEGEESDAQTLHKITGLVFEKAINDAASSHICARLCRRMFERISPAVADNKIHNAVGHPVTGGYLFCTYLLNRVQEGIERGWTAHASDCTVDNDKVFLSERSYDEEAKRQGLGLVRFTGELFKLQMLTERIMHECVKRFLSNIESPGEEQIESLCLLLTSVGQNLDTTKARSLMDHYFRHIKDLSESNDISTRLKYMLLDVIELRSRYWVPRSTVAAPRMTTSILGRAAHGSEVPRRLNTGSRSGFKTDVDFGCDDGWASSASPTYTSNSSHVEKSIRPSPGVIGIGSSSVIAGNTSSGNRRASSLSPATAVLAAYPRAYAAEAPSTMHGNLRSATLSNSGRDVGHQRQRLQLLPRSKPLEHHLINEDRWPPAVGFPPMTSIGEARIKNQIDGDTRKFFKLRQLDEAEQYFKSLPEKQRYKLVGSMFARGLKGMGVEVNLVGELFGKFAGPNKLKKEDIEDGVAGTIEFLEEIALHVPTAYARTAKILFLAKLDENAVKRLGEQIAAGSDSLVVPRDQLLLHFRKLVS